MDFRLWRPITGIIHGLATRLIHQEVGTVGTVGILQRPIVPADIAL